MYRNILRKVNFGLYLLIALAIATVQSTIFGYFPLNYVQPDTLLILAVYLGFKRDILEGGLYMILASMVMEAHSSVGKNFFLTTYMYAFLVAKVLSRTVVVPDFFSSIGIVAALTLLKRLGLLALLGLEGHAANGVTHFLVYLVPGLLVQAALTPLCFSWFSRIDLRTYKDEHAEDEYDINKGF
ncbi:MAG: hypothetical protein HY075_16120 [Deltaproteobacteria bacterium]|nr:hypothetical protein [Deltaproteobacteria bacterium]